MAHILDISLTSFRNIQIAQLSLSPTVNFVFGENGAGKSSFLESIYYLASGKSFRSSDYLNLIQHQSAAFNLFAKVIRDECLHSLGLSRSQNGNREVRIDANNASMANLAAYLPVILLSSFSYQFYTGGPKARRQFLDWLTFHVKHEFYTAWRDFQGLLKQRNKALKQGLSAREVSVWDFDLAIQAEKVQAARADTIEELQPVFAKHVKAVLPMRQVELEYHKGWEQGLGLADQLKEHLARDYQLGYTELGPQRADLQMRVDSCDAGDVLSQGQQKMAVFALQLAMGETLFAETGKKAVFLLDDLASELDAQNRKRIVNELMTMQAQLIITGIELEELSGVIQHSQARVFRVEGGRFEEMKSLPLEL